MNSASAQSQQEAERRVKSLMGKGLSWYAAVEEAHITPLPDTPQRTSQESAPLRSAMRTPASSGTRRNTGLRWDWSGPFSTPTLGPPSSGAARQDASFDEEVDDEDITMESMTGRSVMSGPTGRRPIGRDDQRITNAPALQEAPMFDGSTLADRWVHGEKYKTYVRQLSAYENSTMKPFQMKLSHTVKETARQRIAFYHFKKPADDITEAEWVAYFEEAYNQEVTDYTLVDAEMKKLKMDLRQRDAVSRVDKLVKEMHEVLRKNFVEKLMADQEQPRLVKYLVEALEPVEFRERMRNRVAQDRNKKYKKDVVLFVEWLTQALKTWIEWEPVAKTDEKKVAKPGQQGHHENSATAAASTGKGTKPSGGGGGGAGSVAPAANAGRARGRPPFPCLKCQSTEHMVRDHAGISHEEAERLLAAWKESRAKPAKVARLQARRRPEPRKEALSFEARAVDGEHEVARCDQGTTRARLNDVVDMDALLDTGADVSVVSKGVVDRLAATGKFLEIAWAPKQRLRSLGGAEFEVTRKVNLKKLVLTTPAGPLVLQGVECWIQDEDVGEQLILGRPFMNSLGYSTDGLLEAAVRSLGTQTGKQPTDEAKPKDEETKIRLEDQEPASPMAVNQAHVDEVLEDESADAIEQMALPDPAPACMEHVRAALAERYTDAVTAGLPEDAAAYLKESIVMYDYIFRLSIGCDPPVKVKPLKVRLKPDARPTRCNARKMNPIYTAYVTKHLKELLAAGCLKRNNRSRWGSPPRVVPKGTAGDLRMVVDVRGVNERTDAMPWPMPYVEVLLTYLVHAICFFILDADKMFWQLPLDEESQELFTIMTVLGMLSPTRVLMGQTDAPAFAQATMEEIFADMLNHQLLVWIDDVLGHATSPMQLMGTLRQSFAKCAEYGLKLNPRKCLFYSTKIKWCGRVLSAEGVTHCPERIAGLVNLPPPMTAADLQQFVCAVNWMRTSIPRYSELVAPLMSLLEAAVKRAGTRKKTALKRVDLLHGLWLREHDDAYGAIKAALAAIVPMAHPRSEDTVCVFTDASLDHWGAAVTQLVPGDEDLAVTEREHKPLAFLSGSFAGAASRWPIVEKEAFSILETCKRLEFLLRREKGFRLYTDHRNLVYIFDPYATDSMMPRYQADKLQRWSTVMMMFRYEIYHVAGESNVWGDLLSRWGARVEDRVTRVRALAVVDMRVSPLQDPAFDWPSLDEVREVQLADLRARDATGSLPAVRWSEQDQVYKSDYGQVWIPDDAVDLQQRLCVVAHAGAAGHRGRAVTLQVIGERFVWGTMAADVTVFVRGCLHCLSVKGEMVPRPYGPTLHATKPNEVIHFDFLSMPMGTTESKYVLVLKDDMSNFVELVECASADSDAVFHALMDWFKRFGVVSQWVSDQGSHFKNSVIEDLRRVLGSQHHFVSAYCPWANGSVEVVNRMLLKVLRSLLSELKLPPSEWPQLLAVVQAALNNMPSDKLGGVAPLTAFTQLPATTPLKAMFHPVTKENVTVEWVQEQQKKHLQEASAALEAMHRQVSEEAERKREAARARHKNRRGVDSTKLGLGDFVLIGQVVTHANKLALRWRGPRRITRVIHELMFEVQDLVEPYEKTVHHASRLRFYAESSRNVTSALQDHVRHTEGGHLVERFLDARMGPDTHQPEVRVKWMGLDTEEATWELASELFQDVPVLMRRFTPQVKDAKTRKAMEQLLAEDLARGAAKKAAAPKPNQATKDKKGKRKAKRSAAAQAGSTA